MIEGAKYHNRFGARCRYTVNETNDLRRFADGHFDLVYSLITLQHIRPAYTKEYLREFMRLLTPGGLLIFQLPSHVANGSSSTSEEPSRPSSFDPANPAMEMHAIHHGEVKALLQAAGADRVQIADDPSLAPHWVSCRYLVRKQAATAVSLRV
jgi:ubiquinone/menaquinone biosynthesis C-methylase UbiE